MSRRLQPSPYSTVHRSRCEPGFASPARHGGRGPRPPTTSLLAGSHPLAQRSYSLPDAISSPARSLWTFIILDFHTGGFCGLRIYLLALGFAGLPQVESIIRGFATTTRQRAHVTLLSSLPWASLLLFSCEVAPSAVIRDLLNSACESALVRRRAGRKPRMSSV